MFTNKFWHKRKSIVDRNALQEKNKNAIDSDEVNGKFKDVRSKKVDKNFGIFNKLRKSFVKAKSMDNSDASIRKKESFYKHSSDNLTSEQTKATKSSGLSLRRMLCSNKPRLNSETSLEPTVKADTDFATSTVCAATEGHNYIQPSPKSIIITSTPVIGIVNHGNTCYINSIIQCLNTIDSLVQYFVLDRYKQSLSSPTDMPQSANVKHKDNLSLLLSFSSLLKSLWIKDLNCSTLANDFKLKLTATERSFRCNDQQDAQEFLLFLLNYCHEALKVSSITRDSQSTIRGKYDLSLEKENISRQNLSIVHRFFATHQQLTITCPGCRTRQYKLEPHLCLSLPVPAKSMEPLYYCFIEKDGSQICAAMWINTVSLVQYVRANIAHKFRIDVNRVLIMLINELGYGKCFQDSEQAVDLLSTEYDNQTMSNLWNGIVALEIPSAVSNSTVRESSESNVYKKTLKEMKYTTSPIRRTNSSNVSATNRHSGQYDNLDDQNMFQSLNARDESKSQTPLRYQDDEYQRPSTNYSENFSTDTTATAGSPINLVIIHVEEIVEKSFGHSWRRFSAPVSLLVRKEIEFKDLESIVITQLEAVYHCNIQSKLKSHLRFWVWDGLNNTDSEITSDHQFPLLTEAVESIISWSENASIIRMVGIWSPGNVARLMQTAFANLRLSHSLGRESSKSDIYNVRDNSRSLTLMDAWSSIEENGSVELVMKATLSRRSQTSNTKNISLEDCLKAYMSEEILDAKDAWKCPNCRKFQRATISNSIYTLPDILVLHLKRFQSYSFPFNCAEDKNCRDRENLVMATVGGNNSNSHTGSLLCENSSNNKLNILVDYPLSGLDMRTYLSADANKNSPKKIISDDYFYDLIAVCNHQGTLSTGHYTAFCRSSVDYKWRLFNDDVVKEVSTDKVIQPNAYILFYQRRSSIVCLGQHWSSGLNTPKPEESVKSPSPQSYTNAGIQSSRKSSAFCRNDDAKPTQRKSDPPVRRVTPYQNKVSYLRAGDSSLQRPLPLDNNCNSIRHNTPIVDDDGDEEEKEEEEGEEDGATSQGSTSYDEFIPASVTRRPLRLHTRPHAHAHAHAHAARNLSNSKSQ